MGEPPPGVRPTSERVREALGSALEVRGALRDARTLDLFAGTGALSFEALSRGAASALMAEKNPKVALALRKNAELLGLAREARVVTLDLLRDPAEVAHALAPEGPFDLIFADPPYAEIARAVELLDALIEAGSLAEGGIVALEGPSKNELPAPRRLAQLRVYRYGDTFVSLLVHPSPL